MATNSTLGAIFMSTNTALQVDFITKETVQNILKLRQSKSDLKKWLSEIEEQLRQIEAEVMDLFEDGAYVDQAYQLSINISEKRYVSWKTEFIKRLSKSLSDQIIESATPKSTKKLKIEAA